MIENLLLWIMTCLYLNSGTLLCIFINFYCLLGYCANNPCCMPHLWVSSFCCQSYPEIGHFPFQVSTCIKNKHRRPREFSIVRYRTLISKCVDVLWIKWHGQMIYRTHTIPVKIVGLPFIYISYYILLYGICQSTKTSVQP